MEDKLQLYMVMLGATPEGRLTEQHDIFFGIGRSLKELIPQMNAFWPEAKGKMHIDAWREVTAVGNFSIEIVAKEVATNDEHLFFINLGGYKENEFEEYHYKTLAVAQSLGLASKIAKATIFYKHYNSSHIDDKYGIDVDDIHTVADVLDTEFKENYSIRITPSGEILKEDTLHIGYLKMAKLQV